MEDEEYKDAVKWWSNYLWELNRWWHDVMVYVATEGAIRFYRVAWLITFIVCCGLLIRGHHLKSKHKDLQAKYEATIKECNE